MTNHIENRSGQNGHLGTVSVGQPRPVDRNGRPGRTAIYKAAIDGPVRAVGVNLDGDDQADRNAHGGFDKPRLARQGVAK